MFNNRLIKNSWITTKLLLALYTFFNLWFFIIWRLYHQYLFFDYFIFLLGYILIYLYSESLNYIIKNSWLRALSSASLISLYHLLGKYHFRVKTSFDFSIIIDNFFEMFSKESAGVLFSTIKPKDFYITGLIFLILLLSHRKWNIFSCKVKRSFKKSAILFISYIILIFLMPFSHCELSYTLKSITEHFFSNISVNKRLQNISLEKNVFLKHFKGSTKDRPDIFIFMIESFNSLYVEKKTANGSDITPVFNSLIKEGLYIDDFYGNTVQTIKGQYACLCSKVPLLKGKASYDKDGKDLECLPRILNKNGYYSYFHKCFSDLSFDNTSHFMQDLGFDLVRTTDTTKLSSKEKTENIWGWGVQDNISYKQYIDKVIELKERENKPIFSLIHSVSHHMKFNHVPKKQSQLYKGNPSTKKQHFLNSLNVSDRYLGEAITYLKEKKLFNNSLIIITGDHSYPAGEHGFFDNQTSFYQEFFKTPFLLIWKNHIQEKRIKESTFSHLDITPSLIDLLGFSGSYELVGNSIFSEKSQYAYLVQPYNGIYLGIVHWPYKYVWERKMNREFLFNIKNDPKEQKPIVNEAVSKDFREKLDYLILGSQ